MRLVAVHDIVVALLSGLLAWGLTAASFMWLLEHLGEAMPALSALAVYPLAMLVSLTGTIEPPMIGI